MDYNNPKPTELPQYSIIYRFGTLNQILSDKGDPILEEDIQRNLSITSQGRSNAVGVYQIPMHEKLEAREQELWVDTVKNLTNREFILKVAKDREEIPPSLITLLYNPQLNKQSEIRRVLEIASSTGRVSVVPYQNKPNYELKFLELNNAHKETTLDAIMTALSEGSFDDKVEKLTKAMYPLTVSKERFGLTMNELALMLQIETIFGIVRSTEGTFNLPRADVERLVNAHRKTY